MPQVTVKGETSLYVREINSQGEVPLLFVHGAGGNQRHWIFQIKEWKKKEKLRLLLPDLPGHGRSPGEARETVEEYREIIRELVFPFALPRFFLVGHSMGGAIALDYARFYPGDLHGIVLLGTAARLSVPLEIIKTFQRGKAVDALPRLVYHRDSPPELLKQGTREVSQTSPRVFARDFSACDGFNLIRELPRIRVPTQILVGSGDRMVPLAWARQLYRDLPQAELKVIEKAGHMMMLEQPEAVNRAIEDFIGRVLERAEGS